MKRIFNPSSHLLVVFLLNLPSLNAQVSQPLSSDAHLLAHFEFNRSTSDSSPNNLELTSDRNTYAYDRFGNEAFSLFFSPPPAGNLYQLPTPLVEGKIPMTISFWANPLNWIGKFLEPPSPMDIMNFSRESNDPEVDKDDFWLQFKFDFPNKTQTLHLNTGTHIANIETEIQEDTWRHYAIVFGHDQNFTYNNIQFYIDGTSMTVTTSENWNEGEYDFGANPLNIGGSFLKNTNGYIGYLDELRVYNTALNSEEIRSLHQFEKTYDPIAIIPPRSAIIEPVIVDGIFRDINILDSGAGYVEPPEIYIVGKPDAGSDYRVTLRNGQVTRITKIGGAGIFQVGRRTRAIIGSAPFDPKLSISTTPEGNIQLGMKVRVRTSYQLLSSQDLKKWEPLADPINSFDENVSMEIDTNGLGKYFQLREIE